MKPVNQMTLEEVNDELLVLYKQPKKGPHAAREKALEDRFDELMREKCRSIEIVNPEAFEEGQG